MEEKKINPMELLQNAAAEITKTSQSLDGFCGQLKDERNLLVSKLASYRQKLDESKSYLEAKYRTLSEKIDNASEKGIKVDMGQLERENEKLKDYVERLKGWRTVFYYSVSGMILLVTVVMTAACYFYKESVRSKQQIITEWHGQYLKQLEEDGKVIAEKKHEQYVTWMLEWAEKNPRDSKKLFQYIKQKEDNNMRR
jgi:hypothetical protein